MSRVILTGCLLAGLTMSAAPPVAAQLSASFAVQESVSATPAAPAQRVNARVRTRWLPTSTALPRRRSASPAILKTSPLRTKAPVELNVTPGLYDAAALGRVLDVAVRGGATSIYSVANWNALAPNAPRAYDWSALDRLVTAAQARHLKLRFQLTSTPDWVHPELADQGVSADRRAQTPPLGAAQLAEWKTFASDVASRYGSQVGKFEMWNEPNEQAFWTPGPNPAQYVPLLQAGYEGVKSVSPTSQVLFGGLSRNDIGYLTEFYRVADATPGVPANHWFDVLDVHPYSGDRAPSVDSTSQVWQSTWGTLDENFLGIKRMKALMGAHGEPDKHIFIGEYGFRTTATAWTAAVSDSTRASYLAEAYHLAGALPYVDGLNWYSLMATQWDDPAWTLVSAAGVESQTFQALVALKR